MRPKKFRAWDKANKRMIVPEQICRIHFNGGIPYGLLLWNGTILLKKDFELMQPTGLCDKDGKDLDWWEGDLFRINGVVHKLVSDGGCYFLDGIKAPYRLRAADVARRPNGNVPKVIGNIHDNPELIEENK